MSRISIERLTAMRQYKAALAENIGGVGGVLDSLPADFLSARGYTRSDVSEKIGRMLACADRLEVLGESGDHLEILRGNYCKCPAVCAVCSSRLQGRRRAAYGPAVRAAVGRWPWRYMLTLTVKDGPALGERLDHLRASWRRWYRMGQRRGDRRSYGEAAKIGAALAGVELKRSDRGAWHVHIHALVFADRPLSYQVYDSGRRRAMQRAAGRRLTPAELASCVKRWGDVGGKRVPLSKLSGEWLAASGGDSVNVDCRPLPAGRIDAERAALEVLKYSSKLASVRPGYNGRPALADMVSLICESAGRRLFMALRDFRGGSAESDYNSPGEADRVAVWDYSGGRYGFVAVRPAGDRPERAEVLSEVGKVVGMWRRERRALLGRRGSLPALPVVLDALKVQYRRWIGEICRSGSRAAFVASLRPPPAARPAVWVQTTLALA